MITSLKRTGQQHVLREGTDCEARILGNYIIHDKKNSFWMVTVPHLSEPPPFCCMLLCVWPHKFTKSQFSNKTFLCEDHVNIVFYILQLTHGRSTMWTLAAEMIEENLAVLFYFLLLFWDMRHWICANKPSKYTLTTQHTWTNTHFPYTSVYEHTDKKLLTGIDR